MSEVKHEEPMWTEPGAAALFTVGTVTIGIWAFTIGLVQPTAAVLLIAPCVATIIASVIGAIISFRRLDILGGTVNMALGAILGAGGSLQFWLMAWAMNAQQPMNPRVNGFMWIGAGVTLILIGIAALRVSWWSFFGNFLAGISLVLIGLSICGFGGLTFMLIGGWIVIGFSLFGLSATAILIDTMARKPLLPLGGPLIKG